MGRMACCSLTHDYISPRDLENLKRHKSFGKDYSVCLQYILGPYLYKPFVSVVPLWIAPNLITLIGFFFVLFSHLLIWNYAPQLVGSAPGWVYIVSGASIFIYQTLDNIDGRQARRTGTSSPMGELFDHGVDSLAGTFITLSVASMWQQGASWNTLAFLSSVYIQFFCATYEEYNVGGLYLGYFNGPIEGLLMTVGIFMLSGVFGTAMWQTAASEYFGSLAPAGWSLSDALLTLMCVFGIVVCFGNLSKAAAATRARGMGLATIVVDFLPLYVLLGSMWTWALISPSNIYQTYPRWYCLTFGCQFAYFASNLTLSHLSKRQYRRYYIVFVPTVGACMNAFVGEFFGVNPPVNETLMLIALGAFTLYTYGTFVLQVISRITAFLGIKCLTIPPPELQKPQ